MLCFFEEKKHLLSTTKMFIKHNVLNSLNPCTNLVAFLVPECYVCCSGLWFKNNLVFNMWNVCMQWIKIELLKKHFKIIVFWSCIPPLPLSKEKKNAYFKKKPILPSEETVIIWSLVLVGGKFKTKSSSNKLIILSLSLSVTQLQ